MTTFSSRQRLRRHFIDELHEFSCGLEIDLIEKIILYSESLAMDNSDEITEATYIGQMAHQFNLSNLSMITLTFEYMRYTRRNPVKTITVEEFSKLICIYLTPNMDMKIQFVFHVYDMDRDGVLTRPEITILLKPTIMEGEDEFEEMLKELVELVLKIVDCDRNGTIDLDEFRDRVKKDIMYIELLGQCLPNQEDILRFKEKLTDMSTLEVREMFESEMKFMSERCVTRPKGEEYYPMKLDL